MNRPKKKTRKPRSWIGYCDRCGSDTRVSTVKSADGFREPTYQLCTPCAGKVSQ